MTRLLRSRFVLSFVVALTPLALDATVRNDTTGGSAIEQFLSQDDEQHPYRAIRRLEAENGSRKGWLTAVTEFSPSTGFRYQVTGEGGSPFIRDSVLRTVLDGERDVIAKGETARAALAPLNYTFQDNGINADGLVQILLSPRRKERLLLAGTLFLRPGEGELVRLEGRLAKSPSFWVKEVHVVRSYDRIDGVVLPVAMESKAQLRMFGAATFHMTYDYSEVDGHALRAPQTVRAR